LTKHLSKILSSNQSHIPESTSEKRNLFKSDDADLGRAVGHNDDDGVEAPIEPAVDHADPVEKGEYGWTPNLRVYELPMRDQRRGIVGEIGDADYFHCVEAPVVSKDPEQPTQKTRPHGVNEKTGEPYRPIEIPVPTRKEVEDLMRGVSGKRRSAPDSGSKQ
jgi:hypothetical protein